MIRVRFCASVAALFTVASSFAAPGRQLTGVYAPASTPALPPEEAAKKMTLPEGFEARIFASEPQVVNPVAMTWDERGRLWVVELYEYPLGAAPGTKPRDNVKILEDTDNDGRADKVTVFADGLNLATGVLIGYGGVFVGQAPHLYFMEDTNGDDKADKKTIVKTGFGLEDRHELLNGFTWGPDGYLYMTHGVFTHSKVKDPNNPEDDGVTMTAAVARYHPRTKKFEIFAEGTSNPWGVDFDRAGNAFVSACVIDHLFHMAPGGIYVRQAGSPPHPYAYELLPSIVDHKHFRAAYSGVQIYQGDQYPEEYRGTILMGNIHDSSVHQDKLTPVGATFKASFMRDFVRANDGWFRPVSTQVGPDGAVWIMDWYDKYPCYQNANADPEGVDRAHGRIWRIVYTGNEKGKPVGSRPDREMNLAKLSNEDLAKMLEHKNAWHRRTAQRIFAERGEGTFGRSFHRSNPVLDILQTSENPDARLAALWTLHGMGELEEVRLEKTMKDKDPAVRAWTARLIGERGYALPDTMKWLYELSKDEDITVRAAVAVAARQFVSGALTVNTKPHIPVREVVTGGVLSGLWFSTKGEVDPTFTYLYWMAVEPLVAYDPLHALGFYEGNGAMTVGGRDLPHYPFAGVILTKIMRRICDLNDPQILSEGLLTLKDLKEEHGPAIVAALKGVIEGQRGRPVIPSTEAVRLVSKWSGFQHKEASSLAQNLGTLWGDAEALNASLKVITDSERPVEERTRAIQSVRQQKVPAVRDTFVKVLSGAPEPVVQAAISGLREFPADDTAELLLKEWKQFSPASRRIAADVLTSRSRWAQRLISSIEHKSVVLGDIPAPVVRNLLTSKDEYVRNRATTVIGKFRETSADKNKLIAEKKGIVLRGPVDMKKGHEVAQRTCFTCHKLHGEGAEVGPDITGVGRSSLDALLANIIDPNQLIGAGYENVEVTTKDDRTVAGRMIENTDARVRLLVLGGKEETIAKADVANLRVSELSVMPEGLEQMPDEDFRNLVWYILNPPQDNKAIFLYPEERKLVVKAKTQDGTIAELATYVADPALRPYLHPVKDPSGQTTLTQDKPADHPWQHGIFTGLHKVNGIDFWSEKEGKLRFVRLLDVIQEQDHVGWKALVEWVGPDGKVLEEEQFVKVYAPTSPRSYNIDFDWTLRALDKPVKIGKHEYGGFAVRMEYDGKPSHLNSNGERDKATAEKRAAWCNVSRQFGGKTYGIVVYDHPSNQGFPAMWRVDAQGLINPSPSLKGDWSIEPGRERTFHYRLTVHEGAGDAQLFEPQFKSYSAITFQQMAAMHPDKESVALWNPEWKLNVPDFEHSPLKLPEYAGKRNVLLTHPFAQDKPSALERKIEVPAEKKTSLTVNVAAHEQGDWELRIFVSDQPVKKQLIDRKGERWKTVTVDLSSYAGKTVTVRLENAANNWDWEFGYWSDLRVTTL